ncbi:MAG: tRNA pseudouridine(55) synthase TruB [Nitrospira sp.]|nr:tRNA pseudouridine(55) synthase TruB [Nitrospira sp.]
MASGQTATSVEPRGAAEAVLGDGILNVKKELGWTSHDVVAKLRGILRGQKIGHAGTLDPAATGVLPILLGRGTRIAEYLLDWDKEYDAVLRLGETTDTQDATGSVLSTRSTDGLTEEAVRSATARFQGKSLQLPPMYSAVKVGGVPLYKAARAGRTVERERREVMVYEIAVLGMAGRDVSLHVRCAKGTYVRTLCADIGEALGVGGHLLSLERSRVGPLTVRQALTIEDLRAKLLLGRLAEDVLSLDQALEHLPALVVDEATAARVLHGVPVSSGAWTWAGGQAVEGAPGQPVRVKDRAGRLLALGRTPAEGADRAVAILKMLADV